MKKINFKEFPVKKNISGTEIQKEDLREQFADLIYSNINGIRALNLAQKIYKSEGEEEYNDGEIDIINSTVNELCIAKVIDSLQAILK